MTTDRNFCRGGPMWPPVQAPLVKGGRAAKRRGILSSERFVANGIPHPAAPGASLPLLSRCARQFPIPSVAARHLPLIRGVGPLTGRIGLSQGGRGGRCAVSRTRRGPPEGASRRRPRAKGGGGTLERRKGERYVWSARLSGRPSPVPGRGTSPSRSGCRCRPDNRSRQ